MSGGQVYLLERQATLANNSPTRTTPAFGPIRSGCGGAGGQPQAGTRVSRSRRHGRRLFAGADDGHRRTLDVAIQGHGWLTVQAGDGSEAYTRNGSLQVGPDGTLQLSERASGAGYGDRSRSRPTRSRC